jgi:signal transduction histidine kinase
MNHGLKLDFGKYVSTADVSTGVERNHEPPPTMRLVFRDDHSAFLQIIENMRKSVESVTDLLARMAIEETRARFLTEASVRLFASRDEDAMFATLSQLFVPKLADGASVFSVHGDDVVCRAVAHTDLAKERFVRALSGGLIGGSPTRTKWAEQVLNQGRSIDLAGQTFASAAACLSNDSEASGALIALDVQWMEGRPLVSDGRVLGAIFLFGSTSRQDFAVAGEEMLQSFAHIASMALSNAQTREFARQSIRAREHLMAVAAHDLRNSLSLALLSLSTFDALGDGANVLPQPSRIAFVRKGLNRMQRLVDDLLDFSTIETGHLSISAHDESVSKLIGDAVDTFREAALHKNITLVGQAPAESCHLPCDGFRILQVLSNLIGNALKFTPMGGEVTLMAVDYVDEVEFSVSDTGCGIAEAELPCVFDAYRRANRSNVAGVGLGLSIAKGIVTAHGGRIWVESQFKKGTTFYFRLPKQLSAASKADSL